jgi:enoyl-CoA hydratase/carnithine racemase
MQTLSNNKIKQDEKAASISHIVINRPEAMSDLNSDVLEDLLNVIVEISKVVICNTVNKEVCCA